MATSLSWTRGVVSTVLLAAVMSAAFTCDACAEAAAGSAIRIDVSPDTGRRDHLSPHSANWLIQSGASGQFQVDGVEVTVRAQQVDSDGLHADWWKAGLAHEATMASDGVYADRAAGGLVLTLKGLRPGRHSLVTFHSSLWDEELCAFDVVVDGRPVMSAVQPTRRVTHDADAASAYMEFHAAADKPVIIELRPSPHSSRRGGADTLQRVILNGLEIDTSDPKKMACKPVPASGDEHVRPRPALEWQAAKSAVSHDVYLGTDREAVATATHASPEYRGRHSKSRYASDAADHYATYYWRVDEMHRIDSGADTSERITKGDVWSFRVRQLAFPGAEGYGRFARGGRGGRVLKVTNLNDNGPGSLRAAIEAEGPRTVVFDVSGRIVLHDRLGIRNPYLTIAGQTAPGKGICVSNYNLGMLGTHDIIVRYIRVRPGDTAGLTLDGMGMASTDHAIIDHCSISWTQDEAFSSRGAKNITLQRTLISEALNVAGHKKYEKGKEHGYAASIGGDIGSFHHNLLVHCAGRNWSLAGGLDKATRHTGRLDIRNNVVYNWGHRTTDGGARQVIFVNNYYKPGPASRVFHVLMPERHLVDAFGPQDYYVSGNVMEGRYGADEPLAGVVAVRGARLSDFLVDKPFFESHVKTQPAIEAFEDVLNDVGCNVPALDDHDRRVLDETRHGTTTYRGSITGYQGLPDSQVDVGGWEDYPEVYRPAKWDTDDDGMPDHWEERRGLDPADGSDGSRDDNGDGFTNLEDYLNEVAEAVD